MKIFTALTALLFLCSKASYNAAFVPHRNLNSNKLSTRIKSPISNRIICMNLMPNLASLESIYTTVSHTMENPNIEAGVFRDLAHATLDGVSFLSLSPISFRLIIFVGRLFAITSDYLPDQYMTPDEIIFQLAMLIFSGRTLYADAIKLVSSSTKSISFQDRKIYIMAFLPVGFSWMQYKSLISDALEWVELSPDQCLIEEGDSLFLTYRGDVYHNIDGSNIQRFGSRNPTRVLDMVGNLSMAKELIDSKCRRKRMIKYMKPSTTKSMGQQQSHCKLRAGSDGSLLLRIDINKLLDRANGDEVFFRSIKNLVSNGIENRLIMSLNER